MPPKSKPEKAESRGAPLSPTLVVVPAPAASAFETDLAEAIELQRQAVAVESLADANVKQCEAEERKARDAFAASPEDEELSRQYSHCINKTEIARGARTGAQKRASDAGEAVAKAQHKLDVYNRAVVCRGHEAAFPALAAKMTEAGRNVVATCLALREHTANVRRLQAEWEAMRSAYSAHGGENRDILSEADGHLAVVGLLSGALEAGLGIPNSENVHSLRWKFETSPAAREADPFSSRQALDLVTWLFSVLDRRDQGAPAYERDRLRRLVEIWSPHNTRGPATLALNARDEADAQEVADQKRRAHEARNAAAHARTEAQRRMGGRAVAINGVEVTPPQSGIGEFEIDQAYPQRDDPQPVELNFESGKPLPAVPAPVRGVLRNGDLDPRPLDANGLPEDEYSVPRVS